MFVLWSARGVEQRRLRQNDERPLRMPSLRNITLRLLNLFERSPEVDCGRSSALSVLPGNWRTQRPVHLKDAQAIAISFEFPAIGGRQPFAGQTQKLTRRYVTQHCAR